MLQQQILTDFTTTSVTKWYRCAREIFQTSSNFPFPNFSQTPAKFNSRLTQSPTFLEFGKAGLGREKVEETLKTALTQGRKVLFSCHFAVFFVPIAFFQKLGNYRFLKN